MTGSGKAQIRMLAVTAILGLLPFAAAPAGADSIFDVSENAFVELGDKSARIHAGPVTVWCLETGWAATTMPFKLKGTRFFYGDGQVPRHVELKFYFAFRGEAGADLGFRKIKYMRPKPFQAASLGSFWDWQWDLVFDKARAATRKTAQAFTPQAVSGAEAWQSVSGLARATGVLTVGGVPAIEDASRDAAGTLADLVWNRSLADHVIRAPSPGHRDAFLAAAATLLAMPALSEPPCADGSIFAIASPEASDGSEPDARAPRLFVYDFLRQTEVGQIRETVAGRLVRELQESGGSDPYVVFADRQLF